MDSNELNNTEAVSSAIQIPKGYAVSFYLYLKDIYNDLTTRKEEIDEGKMSQITFENFLDLPLIVTEKIYNTFNQYKKDHLDESEFVNGLFTLFAGALENKIRLVFEIFDIQKEGRIMKEDVILLLSHLSSMKGDCDLNLLNEINDNFWGIYNSMDYQQFLNILENKNSDIFVLYLSFLYSLKPFTEESLKFFHQNTFSPNKSKFCPENKTRQFLQNSLNIPEDNYFFDRIKCPSRNLILYLVQNLHYNLNLKLVQRKVSSNKHVSNGMEIERKSLNSNFGSNCGSIPILKEKDDEEELINNIKLFGSPNGSQHQSTDVFHDDERFGFTWDINGTDEMLNSDDKEKLSLNLSNVNHNRNNPDHSFSNSSSENNSSLNITLDDQHIEMIVYKISSFSKRKVKTYKIISIGNDIYYFKLNKLSVDHFEYKGFHHLSGCCLDTVNSELFKFEGENYIPFKIFSSCGGKIIYDLFYFKSLDDLKIFVEKVKYRLGIRNILNYYDLYEELGKGQFGKVRLARNKNTGEKVAVKVIKKQYMKSKEVQMIKWEVDIMRFLININNPYVIKTYDIFESRSNIYLVMECLEGGNLNTFLVDQGAILKEKKAKEIMLQICRGVKFLHQYGIIHRDLKPENIMLIYKSSSPQIKIMDFGLSKVLTKYDKTGEGYGSLCYLAPEVLLKQTYGHKVDIWSIGVILYYLLSGFLPFDDSKDEIIVIAKKIVNLEISAIYNSKTKNFSQTAKILIGRCLDRNVERRLSSYQIVDSEWFWT